MSNDKTTRDFLAELQTLLEECRDDNSKVFEKGVKAAGVRLRVKIQNAKDILHAYRHATLKAAKHE